MSVFLKTSDLALEIGVNPRTVKRWAAETPFPGQRETSGGHFIFEDGPPLRAAIEQRKNEVSAKRATAEAKEVARIGRRIDRQLDSRLPPELRKLMAWMKAMEMRKHLLTPDEKDALGKDLQKTIDVLRELESALKKRRAGFTAAKTT